MYIRFITREQDEDSRSFVGVFTHACALRESDQLQPHEKAALESALLWLKTHLKVPKILKQEGNERAICWFKSAAKRPLEYVWEIVHVLREHGTPVEMIKTRNPGAIIYEDGWQVAAKPNKTDRIRTPQGQRAV